MIRIIILLFLLFNYRSFTGKSPVRKEITLLLLVFLLDIAAWLDPYFLFEALGRPASQILTTVLLGVKVVLFSFCYLKNQSHLYLNHYLLVGLVILSAAGTLGFALWQNQYCLLGAMVAGVGSLIFGALNLRYRNQPSA